MELKLIAVLILALVSEGICLQCYTCQYSTSGGATLGQDCNGPNVSASHSMTCATGVTSCITSVLSGTNSAGQGGTIISRTCSVAGASLNGCASGTFLGFNGEQCVYSCSTDNCNTGNGSGKLAYAPTLLCVTILALFKLAF